MCKMLKAFQTGMDNATRPERPSLITDIMAVFPGAEIIEMIGGNDAGTKTGIQRSASHRNTPGESSGLGNPVSDPEEPEAARHTGGRANAHDLTDSFAGDWLE